jgi:hypothetical protein
MGHEREILEHAVHTVAEQAGKADELVDEAKAAGGGDHPRGTETGPYSKRLMHHRHR